MAAFGCNYPCQDVDYRVFESRSMISSTLDIILASLLNSTIHKKTIWVNTVRRGIEKNLRAQIRWHNVVGKRHFMEEPAKGLA